MGKIFTEDYSSYHNIVITIQLIHVALVMNTLYDI